MIFFKNFWLFSAWLIFILYLSFAPLSNWPQPSLFDKIYMDKVVHVFMYCLLTFFLLRSIARQQKNGLLRYEQVVAIVIFCAGLGIVIEFLQPVLTMYRKFEWMDMVANATGAVSGWFIFRWVISKRWFRLRRVRTGTNQQ
jgi:VanZ family protein